jgi:uncharacterized membrane protein YeaQ/YmgE (transglycosylase-associated protein family)
LWPAVLLGAGVGLLRALAIGGHRRSVMVAGIATGVLGALTGLWILDVLGIEIRSAEREAAVAVAGASLLILLLSALGRPPRVPNQ